jgi:NAD(P)-dependent dehydrogenase (short-subunit alcohol dehydrogenase family)
LFFTYRRERVRISAEDSCVAQFDDKVALVTGATAGIGRATALAFAKAGAKVVAAGRRKPEGEETVHLIQEAGGDAMFVRADVCVEAEVENLVDRAVSIYGRLDCAFNNAGTIALSVIADETETDFDSVVDTNVRGVFACLKHEIRQMSRLGGGAIVNASSLAGLKGSRDRSLYAASKHAVIGLTKSAALEVAGLGIRVNAVCPGAIEGQMDELFMSHFHMTKDQMKVAVPLGRVGRPEDVAAAVLFLCSNQAAFITGAVLSVDGGLSAA